ncbi:MAG: HDOD domain-containing protein [Chitinivibrionales bacterium]|nr:HDOD domain-containing protein [Chitinivibrionales bacterium]
MITLNDMMSNVQTLPALPAAASRLAAVIADPTSGIEEIVEVVRFDQALTAAVLREANGISSGSRRIISTVKDAVIRLGGARILSRSLAGALQARLAEALPGYGYGERELWRHSVAAAVAAEELGAYVNNADKGMAFTAALLHDIGKLILGRRAGPAVMQAIWECVEKNGFTCVQAENETLGFSHAVLGAEIIKAWQLPEIIENAVRDHHAVGGIADACTDTVAAANIIAHCIGTGLGYEGMSIAVDDALSERLDLCKEDFERVCAGAMGRFTQVLALYE